MDAKILMQDLAAGVAQRSGLLKKDSDTFVRLFFETIEERLSEEKNVKVKGLGTFKIVEVSGRDSVNVNTGERIHIKGHSKISFTPDTGLRDFVNRPFADFETIVLNEGVDIEKMEYTGEAEKPELPAEEPVATVQEPAVPAEESAAPVEESVVEEPAPAAPAVETVVEEPAPAAPVEEPVVVEPAPAVPVEKPVVEEPAPAAPAEEPVVEEPAPAAPTVETVVPIVETVAPTVEPEKKGSGASWIKYVACAACVAIIAALAYCFGTGMISFGSNEPAVAQTKEPAKTEAVTEKPVAKVDPAKADSRSSVTEVNPEVAAFDSATVNGRYPYGAYEICGVQCTHVVAEGEDIETIAKQYLKSKSNKVYVAAMNDLNMYKPVIEVGQKLIIPEIRSKKFARK